MSKTIKQIKDDIQAIIDGLISCENEGKKCSKCKKKSECLIFLRSAIAVALQFILLNLPKEKEEGGMYV